jgi:hypothetical protein
MNGKCRLAAERPLFLGPPGLLARSTFAGLGASLYQEFNSSPTSHPTAGPELLETIQFGLAGASHMACPSSRRDYKLGVHPGGGTRS